MLKGIVWNETVYLYKMDLALNNRQMFLCHKLQPNNQRTKHKEIYAQIKIAHETIILTA